LGGVGQIFTPMPRGKSVEHDAPSDGRLRANNFVRTKCSPKAATTFNSSLTEQTLFHRAIFADLIQTDKCAPKPLSTRCGNEPADVNAQGVLHLQEPRSQRQWTESSQQTFFSANTIPRSIS
jgi:hypothetical protein